MNSRISRFSLGLSLAGIFLVGSLTAAPLTATGLAPVAIKSAPITETAALDRDAAIALLRDHVYTLAKELGAPVETLRPSLDRIRDEAKLGQVDMASIYDITSTILDYDTAMKMEGFLLGFAETAAFGKTIDGVLPDAGLESAFKALAQKKVDIGRINDGPGSLVPLNGGTCLACPSFDFGPFTPTAVTQTHSESTDSNSDCNTYRFNVTSGVQYQFSLCVADGGMANFDTRLTGTNASSGCTVLFDVDDGFVCNPQERVLYTATFTGLLNVRVKGWQTSPPWEFGSYTLAYKSLPCSTCTTPISAITPTATCQYLSSTTTSICRSNFYTVNVNAGASYTFTTCPNNPAGCTLASGGFDTWLVIRDSSTCAILAFNDDQVGTCSSQPFRSTLAYTAAATGTVVLEITGYAGPASPSRAFGTCNLGYVTTAAGGCTNSCASGPFLATLVPNATCQTTANSIAAPCPDRWYQVSVAAAGIHEFTTCSAAGACPGSPILGFDSILELYNISCTLLASDNDGCGAPRSNLTFNIPVAGTYKLRVRSATGSPGAYTLTYRTIGVACTAPSAVTVTPTSGIASTGINTCRITQTFATTASGSPTMTYNWTITPPAGGTAAPASGSSTGAAGATNPATFVSTLTREGNFTVSVNAVNSCGTSNRTITYTLVDNTKPVFTTFPANTTVACTAVPPVPVLAASDNCDPNPVETFSSVTTPGSCPGNYRITRTWTARDRAGNISVPRSQVITVRDTVAPVIVPNTAVQYCIYPPNHELVCFSKSQFSPVITDNCSPPITWKFFGILSSEAGADPCGDGNIDPDFIISPAGDGFCVRSERCGQDPAENDGRIYLLLATATDACGNTSQPTAIGSILVPHDSADTSNCITP